MSGQSEKRGVTKPRLFIGSSGESRRFAEAIQRNLDSTAEVTLWTQAFEMGRSILDQLAEQLNSSDFGVFVLAPDDITIIRGKEYDTARDNVLFELGLFVGRLGSHRSYFVVPRGTGERPLRILSDLGGIVYGEFEPNRRDKNDKLALGAVSNEIAVLMERYGPVRSQSEIVVEISDLLKDLVHPIDVAGKTSQPPRKRARS